MSENSLFAGAVLSATGGFVTFVIGAVVAGIGASGVAGNLVSGPIVGVGVAVAVVGIVLLLLGIALKLAPEIHTGLGIAIVILSSLTLFGGSAFYPGAALCIVGGVLGILSESEEEQVWEAADRGVASAARRIDPSTSARRPGVCPECGRPTGESARVCPHCGTPLIPRTS
ncbi:MAG: zinc-ribbon domain-containing protein [Thermoplasmata archaeon]